MSNQNKNAIDAVKKSVSDQVQSVLQKIQAQNAQKQRDLEQQLQQTQHQSIPRL